MHITPDSLSVGFSNPKLSLFTACLPPCHSARSRRRSRRIHHRKNSPRLSWEEERSQMVGEGRWRSLSHTPHPPWWGTLPRENVVLHKVRQWILQLRASPSCRMTWVRFETATNSVGLSSPRWIMSTLQYAESWTYRNFKKIIYISNIGMFIVI